MLTLLAPLWIWGAGAIALAGAVALWRGGKNKVAVSSTILWRDLTQEAAGAKRRSTDFLWILLWAAAVLAAIAAAQPEWTQGTAAELEIPVRIAMRALPGAKDAEIFVANTDADPISALMISADGAPAVRVAVDKNGIVKLPAAEKLEVGCISGTHVVAQRTLTRQSERPLVVTEIGRVHPLLRKVMEIQPGFTQAELSEALHVVLVGALRPAVSDARMMLPARDGLVIFTGNVLPADFTGTAAATAPAAWKTLAPPAKIEAAAPSALAMDNGKPIVFAAMVSRCRAVQPPAEWQVILRAGASPLVLVKRDAATNLTLVYLATTLAADDTDWFTDTSFPIFFSRLVETMRPAGGGDEVIKWTVSNPASATAAAVRRVNFTAWIAAAAVLLVLLVAGALVRRGTISRAEAKQN